MRCGSNKSCSEAAFRQKAPRNSGRPNLRGHPQNALRPPLSTAAKNTRACRLDGRSPFIDTIRFPCAPFCLATSSPGAPGHRSSWRKRHCKLCTSSAVCNSPHITRASHRIWHHKFRITERITHHCARRARLSCSGFWTVDRVESADNSARSTRWCSLSRL